MKRIFTPSMNSMEQRHIAKDGKNYNVGPYEMTLCLIRQFARVYQYEPALKVGLCSYIAN
ncbi:MAG: hypothetical protein LBN71_00560 [Tannerella sp.]|nr:hypothetical protein [Tannerella sp.]